MKNTLPVFPLSFNNSNTKWVVGEKGVILHMEKERDDF